MEWVETTAKTIEGAKELALDQLGVDEQEAEFEVLTEPRKGLFGLARGEARVRARVEPKVPQPKSGGRRRGRGSDRNRGGERSGGEARRGPTSPTRGAQEGTTRRSGAGRGRSRRRPTTPTGATEPGVDDNRPASDRATGSRSERPRPRGRPERSGTSGHQGRDRSNGESDRNRSSSEETRAVVDMDLTEQGRIVEQFLDGLLGAFDLEGDIRSELVDDETLEVRVEGSGLGLLIGQKGRTLSSIHELSRAVLHREADGPLRGRIRLDVAGYRERRKVALEAFVAEVAERVRREGVEFGLEPMSAADRKIVHDAIAELDGVDSVSEGEDPDRRVVVIPVDDQV